MDQGNFDRMAVRLGASLDRRRGIAGALAAVAALATGRLAADDAAAKPSASGPCGNGKVKDNTCKKASDCCTGVCNTKTNRCRCKAEGESCTETRNCCARNGKGLTCFNGTCGLPV